MVRRWLLICWSSLISIQINIFGIKNTSFWSMTVNQPDSSARAWVSVSNSSLVAAVHTTVKTVSQTKLSVSNWIPVHSMSSWFIDLFIHCYNVLDGQYVQRWTRLWLCGKSMNGRIFHGGITDLLEKTQITKAMFGLSGLVAFISASMQQSSALDFLSHSFTNEIRPQFQSRARARAHTHTHT